MIINLTKVDFYLKLLRNISNKVINAWLISFNGKSANLFKLELRVLSLRSKARYML